MKYKYFTWIQDVLQSINTLLKQYSEKKKKKAESTGTRIVYGFKK
jgi:hypothetical protein